MKTAKIKEGCQSMEYYLCNVGVFLRKLLWLFFTLKVTFIISTRAASSATTPWDLSQDLGIRTRTRHWPILITYIGQWYKVSLLLFSPYFFRVKTPDSNPLTLTITNVLILNEQAVRTNEKGCMKYQPSRTAIPDAVDGGDTCRRQARIQDFA